MKKLSTDEMRNFIFGAEDSLVSTLGVLFGVASAGTFSKTQIFITGLITIVVEAMSMGAGSFLSESSANELDGAKNHKPVIDGVIMFFAYFVFGFIPLTPYLLLETNTARYVSITATIITLFVLGYIPSKKAKSGLKMAMVAGFAALVGFTIAHIFSV